MEEREGAIILINPFEVPAEAEDVFVDAWERAREFLKGQPGYIDTALHRALASDAEFRFINVAQWESPQTLQAAMAQPEFPGREMPFRAHPALYRVIREDGSDTEAGVVLINAFEVPAGSEEDFIAGWERTRDVLKAKNAYLSTRLHQSLSPEADFRFVNIGRYESPQAFQTAVQDPEFRQAAASLAYRPRPGLYEVVRQ